jgi:hypothetical protein
MALSIDGLKYLSHHTSRPADWAALGEDDDVDNYETFSYAETFDFEDTGDDGTGVTQTVVYVRGLGPVAIVVDGEAITTSEIDERFQQADADNVDEVEAQCVQWRAVIDRAQESSYLAEGPMMAWYWVVEDDADSFDEDRLAKMAGLITDLPLCVVWIDGTLGLALTGGGMDLSWHIAEAFIRLGWFPPSSLTLPNFDYRNDDTACREVIVRALCKSKEAHAAMLAREVADALRLLPAPATA